MAVVGRLRHDQDRAGNDGFGTHDPDFLGIVGLFDQLTLPLKRGPNELWFAVSETFGGWAITRPLSRIDAANVALAEAIPLSLFRDDTRR
jgi:hypothetical protein